MHKYMINEKIQIFWARIYTNRSMKKTQIFWVRMPILSSECSLAGLSQQVGKTVDDNSGHMGKANTQTKHIRDKKS